MKLFFKKIVVAIITAEARMVLKKYHPKIVAITGSVGKTSTKDAIYLTLAGKHFVRKSAKSFNSDIGIPLTILGCGNAWSHPLRWMMNIVSGILLIILNRRYPAWLVLEVGADRPGDIQTIASWLSPDAVVVTHIAKTPPHIEFFSSREELIREKGYLVRALKEGGRLVLNADDEDTLAFRSLSRAEPVTYGFNPGSDVWLAHEQPAYRRGVRGVPAGYRVQARVSGTVGTVGWRGSLGRQHCFAVGAACAFGVLVAGLPRDDVFAALAGYEAPPGRMRIVEGIKRTSVVDDTYNSSPVAAEEALRTLWELTVVGRRIAVLGDMLELGKFSADEHKQIGKIASQTAQVIVTVGFRARAIAEGALAGGMSEKNIFQFDEAREAGAFLQNYIHEGDVILIKGSQAMRMERTVEEIMAHPEEKEHVLVRQEPEWRKR